MAMQYHNCAITDYILFEYRYVLPRKPTFNLYWYYGCYFVNVHMTCAGAVKILPFRHLTPSKTEACPQVQNIFEE